MFQLKGGLCNLSINAVKQSRGFIGRKDSTSALGTVQKEDCQSRSCITDSDDAFSDQRVFFGKMTYRLLGLLGGGGVWVQTATCHMRCTDIGAAWQISVAGMDSQAFQQ